jgi:HAD superfamily hydrolase (TIGR01509 family)
MPTLTTIFFDFVGVLLEPDPAAVVSPLVEAIDRRIGAVVDDRQFREGVLNDFSLSEPQLETVLDQVVARYKPFEPLWQLLPGLRSKFRLGIINNGTWLTYPRFNARFGLDRQFDGFVSSAVEGVRKPDPRIYLRACENLHILPGQCLFLDDNKANVAGAVQAGMQGQWWPSHLVGFQAFLAWLTTANGIDPLK